MMALFIYDIVFNSVCYVIYICFNSQEFLTLEIYLYVDKHLKTVNEQSAYVPYFYCAHPENIFSEEHLLHIQIVFPEN